MGLERKHARLGTSADSLVAQTAKNLPTVQETQVRSLGRENPLEKETATHCSILIWEIPWTEEPGGLQSTGVAKSQRRLNERARACTHTHTHTHTHSIIWVGLTQAVEGLNLKAD